MPAASHVYKKIKTNKTDSGGIVPGALSTKAKGKNR